MDEKSTTHCPECGAPPVEGMDCWTQLGAILAWEWQDPDLAAQHFLTVAAYNLQHPAQFTDEAIAALRELFIEHLDHGMPVQEIRRRVAYRMAHHAKGSRQVRVRSDTAFRQPRLRLWSTTIADVYLPHQPTGAAARVVAWAKSIRAELP